MQAVPLLHQRRSRHLGMSGLGRAGSGPGADSRVIVAAVNRRAGAHPPESPTRAWAPSPPSWPPAGHPQSARLPVRRPALRERRRAVLAISLGGRSLRPRQVLTAIGQLRAFGEYVQSGQDADDPATRTARIRAEMQGLLARSLTSTSSRREDRLGQRAGVGAPPEGEAVPAGRPCSRAQSQEAASMGPDGNASAQQREDGPCAEKSQLTETSEGSGSQQIWHMRGKQDRHLPTQLGLDTAAPAVGGR